MTAGPRRSVVLDRCTACGLVYQRGWKQTFEADLYDYYALRTEWPIERVYKPVNARRIIELLAKLGAKVSGRRLLDVGCGAGQFVAVAASLGWDARGIDLSEPAVRIGRRFGARCDLVDFFAETLDEERFDLIVMSELIEHVPNPARFLARASALLADGGLTYITTPNFRSLSRHIVGMDWSVISSQHISYFTPTTFRAVVEKQTDLHVASLATRNMSPETVEKLKSVVKRPPARATAVTARARAEAPLPAAPADLRTQIEGSRVLRTAKGAINLFLDAASVGDSLFAELRKRPS